MNYLKKNIDFLKTKGHSGYKIEKETGLSQNTLSSLLKSTKNSVSLKTIEKLYQYYSKYNISLEKILFTDLEQEELKGFN